MHSPLAVVHPEAQIGKNVTVEPFAFIEKDVVIGDNCRIYPHAVVLEGSRIGKGCHIFRDLGNPARPEVRRRKDDCRNR